MEQLNPIKEEVLKNRVWLIGIGGFGVVIIVALIVFLQYYNNRPQPLDNTKDAEIKMMKEQNAVLHELVNSHKRSYELYTERDSIIKDEIILNRAAIKNIKIISNEKINRFDSYSPNEWAEYFANLPDPR